MLRMLQTIRKIVLFLFGVLLILSGIRGNLVDNESISQSEGSRAAQEA